MFYSTGAWLSPGSTMVELLDPEPKIKGSHPATYSQNSEKSPEEPYHEVDSAIFIWLLMDMVPYYSETAHFSFIQKQDQVRLG